MGNQTSMLHVRINEKVKNEAEAKLESFGFTLPDAVRILLARIAKEGGLPQDLVADSASYDAWFKAQTQKAMNDTTPTVSHEQVMDDIQALIDRKNANVAR
ncbi:MAG: type II toxin-antitoxin system RelB/DinJ family antitoxin [Candidatus Adiutrix sp.]